MRRRRGGPMAPRRGGRRRAGGVLALLLAAAALGACGAGRTPPTTTAPTTSSTTTTAATTTTTVPPTTTTTPPTTTSTVPARRTLVEGDTGPSVVALQRRLTALGYWLGAADGIFGDATQQAVFALQKAAHLDPDGAVGPATMAALARGVVPVPRPAAGDLIEVDLAEDLLLFVHDGTLRYTLNTSTGGGYVYWVDGVSAVAETPVGHFAIYREIDGLDISPLGELWRPKFFTDGFAIHGDSYVPPVPVSHGCVRVSNEAIDWIWAADLAPLGTPVWVY